MSKASCGGPVVMEWPGYFLRDDSYIREGLRSIGLTNEAYSLFCEAPYGRVAVFGGPLEWAVKQAEKTVSEL